MLNKLRIKLNLFKSVIKHNEFDINKFCLLLWHIYIKFEIQIYSQFQADYIGIAYIKRINHKKGIFVASPK